MIKFNSHTIYPYFFWSIFIIFSWTAPLHAEVEKTIQINSQPVAAEVFLLQGRKETQIGKTPLKYKASFHSEKSIIRLKLRKTGYDDTVIKVNATDRKVSVNLKAFRYTASPQDYKDKILKNAQKRINPIIDKFLPQLIETEGRFQYRLNGPVKMVSLGGKPFASLLLYLEGLEGKFSKSGKDRQTELLQELWKQFGHGLAIPLAEQLKDKGVDGLILKIYFDDQKFLFSVSSHIETNIEMVCVAGYEMQNNYNNCKFYDPSRGGCIGGYELQSIYNPCLRKVPRTKSTVVLDPKAATTKGKASASFLVHASQLSSKGIPFNKVPYILIDSKGTILSSLGEVMK